MTERPILFSGPMVRAILAGAKTQTRRPVTREEVLLWLEQFLPEFVADPKNGLSPYGYAGDQLWVRETFRPDLQHSESPNREPELYGYHHRADPDEKDDPRHPWKPSIHMPREACRLRLEVTGVRVERLQDIGEGDAKEEGITLPTNGSHRGGYAILWDSLNAKRGYGWSLNPWVWVVRFRRAA